MRKLGLISSLWAALLIFPLTGFALGLGEIETSSFLNQPLKAEIEVISARSGEIDDLLISLASRDAFQKAGLDRPAGLDKLKFKVEKSEDGLSAKILVSTKTPVTEPFLSFLVEADWAKGRLLREFTVLLDPLSFAQQAVATPPPVTSEKLQAEDLASTQSNTTQASSQVEAQATVSTEESSAQPIAISSESTTAEQKVPFQSDSQYLDSSEEIVVTKGDTLWGISSKFKDDDHSMAQIMLAMQMANPDAFWKDNINNLKVGAVLRVPDMDMLDKLNKQEAYAQVLDQNGLWDEYVARKSGTPSSTAIPETSSGIESSQPAAESQLSLLTPEDGKSDSASLQNDANSENAGQIRKQLALAEEELEAARLENNELSSRVSMLEQQLEKFDELQKLVQIEDDSLALLQKSVEEDEQIVIDTSEQVQPSEEMVKTIETANDDKPSDVMIEAAGDILAEGVEQPSDAEQQMPEMTDEPGQSTEAETILETTADASEEAVVEEQESQAGDITGPAPVIVTEVSDSVMDGGLTDMLPSMDDLLNDPVMLGGLGSILALILGFIFLKRKKSTDAEDSLLIEESDGLIDDDATPIHIPSTTQINLDEDTQTDEVADQSETAVMEAEQNLIETVVSKADDEEDEFAATAIISANELQQVDEPKPVQEEQDDVLNEVDVYLAYGLYDNAEDLLNESLQDKPDRADYRAKLLDTYFATKNKDAFVKEAEILKSLGGAADRFWDRIQIMGFELAPENDLFSGAKDSAVSVEDLEYAKPESADFDIGADEDATDFSNTDFDLSSDSFDISATHVMDISSDDFSETQDLDSLDLDFPDLEEVDAGTELSDDLPDDIVAEDLQPEGEFDTDIKIGEEEESAAGLDMDFSIDDGSVEDDIFSEDDFEVDDEDALSFEMPEEDNIATDQNLDAEIIDLEPTVEAPRSLDEIPAMDEDGYELNLPESENFGLDHDDNLNNETVVISPQPADVEPELGADIEEVVIPFDEDLDFNMTDFDEDSLQSGTFTPSDTVALSHVDSSDEDITEFKPAEVTSEFDAFISEATDEVAIAEIDTETGLDKTGTFAPGDFNDDEDFNYDAENITSVDDIDDIEDLMLPDDVDEVGTKLDLAKAFIDMGDAEGARSSLEEILAEGTDEQKVEATGLLDQIK